MCYRLLLELCSFRNIFKFICTLLTLFLICQELFTFTVTKPTTTSKEEKGLETRDLPEVVICLEPGFDSKTLGKYGYNSNQYYRGLMNGKFIGWNGREWEAKSSSEILEEALIVKSQHINDTMHMFIKQAGYKTENLNYVPVEVELRTLAFPYGRCFNISPPTLQKNTSDTIFNTLSLRFDANILTNDEHFIIKIYFMDKTNSLKIYPDEKDMAGNPLKFRIVKKSNYISTYKTEIFRSHHVQGDPLFKCTEYTLNNSYNDCIQNELLDSFHKILGCQPPLLGKDPNRMCNGRFNISKTEKRELKNLFQKIHHHDVKFKCEPPCTTNLYTTRLLDNTIPHASDTLLLLVFDRTLQVTRSTFSIDSQTFLARLGGSVSSGRTLLWIMITLLGTSQVPRYYLIIQSFRSCSPRC